MDFVIVAFALVWLVISMVAKSKQQTAKKPTYPVNTPIHKETAESEQMSMSGLDMEGEDPCHPYSTPELPTPPQTSVYTGSMGGTSTQGKSLSGAAARPEAPTPRTDVYIGSMGVVETEGADPCHDGMRSAEPRLTHRMRTFADSAENTFEVHNPLSDGVELTPDTMRDALVMSVILQRPCERRAARHA